MSPGSPGSLAWLEAAESDRGEQDFKLGFGAGVSQLALLSLTVKQGATWAFCELRVLFHRYESPLKIEEGPWDIL